jgi:hypothetical protein
VPYKSDTQRSHSSAAGCKSIHTWPPSAPNPPLNWNCSKATKPKAEEGGEVEDEEEEEEEEGASDHRFVYMGKRGSWTALHADVLRSFSWSVNVCGRKRWLLFPPDQTELLKDKKGVVVRDARAAATRMVGEGGDGAAGVDAARFPRVSQATPLVVDQRPGELLFVPSGWYHQVS